MLISLKLEQTLTIKKIYSIHYFQFAAGYIFPGEKHNFWEMVYIDQGEADIGAGNKIFRLVQGRVIFHKPNEFHSIWADRGKGPNIIVISFETSSPAMRYFSGKQFVLDLQQRKLLSQIIAEAELCFGHVLDIPIDPQLKPLSSAPFGSQQLIGMYLMQLLILLIRNRTVDDHPNTVNNVRLTQDQSAHETIEQITRLMRASPDGSLTLDHICKSSGIGLTALKKCFQKYNHTGIMEHYRMIRLTEAKRLLREGKLNISQISEKLGYSSVHYFSTQFKRVIGLTPSDYIKMVLQ